MKKLILIFSVFSVFILSGCSLGVGQDKKIEKVSLVEVKTLNPDTNKFITMKNLSESENQFIIDALNDSDWSSNMVTIDNVPIYFKLHLEYSDPNKEFKYGDIIGWVSPDKTEINLYSETHRMLTILKSTNASDFYSILTDGGTLALHR